MQRPSQQAAAYSRVIQRDGEPPLRLFSHRPLSEVAADIFTDADRRLRKYPTLSQRYPKRLAATNGAS